MTTHLLIASDPDIRARWRQTFPEGRVAPTLADVGPDHTNSSTCWLHLPGDRVAAADLVRAARRLLPDTRLVAMADSPDDEQALALMELGTVGYCHAYAGPGMLDQVATVVANSGLWVGPSLLQRMIKAAGARVKSTAPDPRLATLSPREREVAQQVGSGASNKEIARALDITERTVKAHLSAIFLKLGLRDRLQLALMMRSAAR